MKVFINNSGYECLVLNTGKNPAKFLVHRLIAQTFIPNPQGFKTVNHINGNKLDNSSKNLEWCTHRDNSLKGWETGLYSHKGINHYLAKLNDEKVRKIRQLLKEGSLSKSEIARFFKVSPSTIGDISFGKLWIHVI